MDNLPVGARKRIAATRRRAETALKRALARVAASERVEPYLPAWREYAGALLDAVASELLESLGSAVSDWSTEAKALIGESILPDASLARAALTDEMIDGISLVWDVATGLYYEERRDGTRTLAREEILAPFGRHGDWERFSPECVRYELRRSKEAKALVCAALDQELDMRAAYWLGRAAGPPSGDTPRAGAAAIVDIIVTAPPVAAPGRRLPPGIPPIVTPPPADTSYVRAVAAEYPAAESMPEPPPGPAEPATGALPGEGESLRQQVDRFIERVRVKTGRRITRANIWRAVGHRSSRQFEYWQARSPKATTQDNTNFRRILGMDPNKFVELLPR
jgi:hypothetical protein